MPEVKTSDVRLQTLTADVAIKSSSADSAAQRQDYETRDICVKTIIISSHVIRWCTTLT